MSDQMNEMPLLEVRHLRKLFPAKSAFGTREKKFIKAVDDVSFTLNPRETLGVVESPAAENPPWDVPFCV